MKLKTAVLMLLLAVSSFAADVAGKWKSSVQGPDGEMQIVFDFKVEGDKLTGTVDSPMGSMPITEGKLDGENITFTVSTDQFTVVHKGTVSGDEMKLKADVGDRFDTAEGFGQFLDSKDRFGWLGPGHDSHRLRRR